jgi:hypothetical protein
VLWLREAFQPFVSGMAANLPVHFYKAGPRRPRARCSRVSLLPRCFRGTGKVARLACPSTMARIGLIICILVISLLLDQTSSHTSKLKSRKHSKRRVKGTRTLQQNSRLTGCGQACDNVPVLGTAQVPMCVWLSRGLSDLQILWDSLILKGIV